MNILQRTPKISVIIPLYNHQDYIGKAIESVLNQTFEDFELIVINDGSSDTSEECVKAILDKRIKYYYQENQGAHEAINRGIHLATGEFVSILNSDDEYTPERLEKCLGKCAGESGIYGVFSQIEEIDADGSHIGIIRGAEYVWKYHEPETSYKGSDNIFRDLLAGNFLITTSNLFCRKTVFQEIGMFSSQKYAHDYDFFLRLCFHYPVAFIDSPLLRYRIHQANTLKRHDAEVNLEVAVTLARLLLNNDVASKVGYHDNAEDALIKFHNSLNTWEADRMIMTMIYFGMTDRFGIDKLLNDVVSDAHSPLRAAFLEKIRMQMELWRSFHEKEQLLAAKDAAIMAKDAAIMESEREAARAITELREKQLEMEAVYQSLSYRLGHALTAPFRYVRRKDE